MVLPFYLKRWLPFSSSSSNEVTFFTHHPTHYSHNSHTLRLSSWSFVGCPLFLNSFDKTVSTFIRVSPCGWYVSRGGPSPRSDGTGASCLSHIGDRRRPSGLRLRPGPVLLALRLCLLNDPLRNFCVSRFGPRGLWCPCSNKRRQWRH